MQMAGHSSQVNYNAQQVANQTKIGLNSQNANINSQNANISGANMAYGYATQQLTHEQPSAYSQQQITTNTKY